MRHKYATRGIVLGRSSLGEANASIILLTPQLGLVRARAQGLRRSGAKLAAALTTFAESDVILVRGKEEWRIAGAVIVESWFERMREHAARERAIRISRLLLRLVAGEEQELMLYPLLYGFFEALSGLPPEAHEGAEVLAALRLVRALGLDQGDMPSTKSDLVLGEPTNSFSREVLENVMQDRAAYIARINHGIAASGL